MNSVWLELQSPKGGAGLDQKIGRAAGQELKNSNLWIMHRYCLRFAYHSNVYVSVQIKYDQYNALD